MEFASTMTTEFEIVIYYSGGLADTIVKLPLRCIADEIRRCSNPTIVKKLVIKDQSITIVYGCCCSQS